jgi:DNA invertase Pin-like site-specific DNA recombinase
MLIGYMRVSKTDGSQTTDPQRDALLQAGVDENALYQDRASGKKDSSGAGVVPQGRPRR